MTEEGTGSGSGEEPAAGPTLPTPPAPTLIPSTEPTYTHEGDRHRLGYVTDAFVLSDKDTGQTERFALSDEGWRQAWGAFATKEPAAARGVAAVYRGAPTDRGRTSGLAVGPDGWVTATQPRPDGVRAEDWEPGRCQV